MTLRPYQESAIKAIYNYFQFNDGHPLISAPTGSGKSVMIAAFLKRVFDEFPDQRVIIASHVKELLQQNAEKLLHHWPEAPIGINSAGLDSRRTQEPIIIAGIQSVFRNAAALGHRDLLLVDECHLISVDDESMYRSFIKGLEEVNPKIKIIGFTATPFRMKEGMLTDPPNNIFTDIAYDIQVDYLVKKGFLSPLVSRVAKQEADITDIRTRAGEYSMDDSARLFEELTQAALDEVFAQGAERKKWLFFCCTIGHAMFVAAALRDRGITAKAVHSEMEDEDRAATLEAYRKGEIQCLTNVNVLTTGFDAPDIDLLVWLRPTKSPVLYIQGMGRGMRIAPDKKDCLVLDFAGNIERHGPVDSIKIVKTKAGRDGVSKQPHKKCPKCGTIHHPSIIKCFASYNGAVCGYIWPPKHGVESSNANPLSQKDEGRWVDVTMVEYRKHIKKDAPDAPPTLRVIYYYGFAGSISEWVCFEHQGYAREKAQKWWRDRGDPGEAPRSIDTLMEAIQMAQRGGYKIIKEPKRIYLTKEGKYDRVSKYDFDEAKPAVDELLGVDEVIGF